MTNYNNRLPRDLLYTELAVVHEDVDLLTRNDIYQAIVPFSQAVSSPESVFSRYGEPIHKGEHAMLWRIPETDLVVKVTTPTTGRSTERNGPPINVIGQMLFMHWLNDELDDARRKDSEVTVELPDIHLAFTAPNGGSLQLQSYMEDYISLDEYAQISKPLVTEALRLRQKAGYHISYALGRLSVDSQLTAWAGLEGLHLEPKKDTPFDARHVLVPANTPHSADVTDIQYCLVDQPQSGNGSAAMLFAGRYYRQAGENSSILLDVRK